MNRDSISLGESQTGAALLTLITSAMHPLIVSLTVCLLFSPTIRAEEVTATNYHVHLFDIARADVYMNVGEAMGRAMTELLKTK